MLMNSKYHLEKTLAFSLLLITVVITPFISYDPVNIAKFSLLVISTFYVGINIYLRRSEINLKESKVVITLLFIFLVIIGISTVTSSLPFSEKLYGVEGRNTGSLTYIMLATLLFGVFFVNSKVIGTYLVNVLTLSGIVAASYGLIQMLGLDPFDWINPYSPVFSFFGNPNFFASFMGISSAAAVSKLLDKNISKLQKTFWIFITLLYLLNIYRSKSQQGFLVFIAVVLTLVYLWLRLNQKFSKLLIPYLTLFFIGITAVALDILQRSPWSPFLYKQSITFRGDYWQAGMKMAMDNPFFGVGLDGYRDKYRAALDFERSARLGAGEGVDSAHNVFIDLAAGGGFLLLAVYLGLLFIALNSLRIKIKKQQNFDPISATLIAAWIGYMLQSTISINHIGLAVWGWSLTGYLLSQNSEMKQSPQSKIKINRSINQVTTIFVLVISIGIIIPLLKSDYEYRAAVKSGDILRIEKSIKNFPQSVIKYNFVAQLFESNGFPDRAINIARQAVKVNPNNYEAWQTLYSMSRITPEEKNQAQKELIRLNPNLVLSK
jgi:O-antigen ligase